MKNANPCSPGERLKLLRAESHLTQKEVAENIHCSIKQVGYMENGSRSITRQTAHLLSELFKVDEAWILCEKDYRTQSEKFRSLISCGQQENDLLFVGFCSFAELSGYNVISPIFSPDGDAEATIKQIKSGYQIEKDGKTITLSLEEMNRFENLLCDMVESAIKYLFREKRG